MSRRELVPRTPLRKARVWRVQISDEQGHAEEFTIVAPNSRIASQSAQVRFLDEGHAAHGPSKVEACRMLY